MAEKKDEAADGAAEMPSTIKRSDKHAQEIWVAAHDSAVKT